MLDITSIKKPVFEIKIADGVILHVLPLTKTMLERAAKMRTTDIDGLYGFTAELLTNNEEKKAIGLEDVEKFDIFVVRKIFTDYMQFVVDFEKNPN